MLPGATIADRLIPRVGMAPSVPKRTGTEQVDHPCGQTGNEPSGAGRVRARKNPQVAIRLAGSCGACAGVVVAREGMPNRATATRQTQKLAKPSKTLQSLKNQRQP